MEQKLNSAVVIGFKDNLREKINEREEAGEDIYVFDLVDGIYEYIWDERGIKPFLYNPLVEIPIDIKREGLETRVVQKLTSALCDIAPYYKEEHIFAATLLTGAIIHECCIAKAHQKIPSLQNVRKSLATHDLVHTLNTWLSSAHIKRKTHETVESIAKEMLQLHKEHTLTMERVKDYAIAPLYIWLDNELNFSTTVKTASIGDILNREKPISLFIELPYATYGFYAPLLRAFFVQFIDAQRRHSRYDTDFVCDAQIFPQIESMAQALEFRYFSDAQQYVSCTFCKAE